jgi:uncharacterized protein with NRDE domain
MCTATYIPFHSPGFVLTHSRDEQAARPSSTPPQAFRIGEQLVTFPRDPQGQGTWIATNAQRAVCLLNGAFVPHTHKGGYRHSRGLVPIHYFEFASVDEFYTHYEFNGIEPFTLLCAEVGRLTELRWNGERLYTHEKNAFCPYIWSSVTLYSAVVTEKRESWFREWIAQNSSPSVEAIRHFHKSAGDGDSRNSVRMNRNDELLTLSLTSLLLDGTKAEVLYEDFTQSTVTQKTLPLTHANP